MWMQTPRPLRETNIAKRSLAFFAGVSRASYAAIQHLVDEFWGTFLKVIDHLADIHKQEADYQAVEDLLDAEQDGGYITD